ncbi:MAG: tetratricopeptide repeat protein [Ignavibacteriae bacterium]|nr:tetratricopeptide repeat protein [Ignavibacteriota bacterium]
MNFTDDFFNENSLSFLDNEKLKSKVQKCKEYVTKGQTIAFLDNIEETIQLCIEYDFTEDGIFLTEAALEISPYSSELWLSRGIFFNNLFEFEKAYVCFNKALSLNPSDVETMINKAIAEDNLGLWDEAISTLDNALILEPTNEEILFNLGIFYERNDYYEKAIQYFLETLNIDPEYSDAWYELGFCYECSNQFDNAIDAYKQFLEIDPYSASGWYNYGIVNLKTENFPEAINNFELAVTLNDDFVNAWYNLGVAYSKTTKFIDAKKCFIKSLELDPYDYSIPLNIAQTCEATGDYEESFKYFNDALKLNKTCTEAYIGLGNYYSRKNNIPLMVEYFSLFIRYNLAQKIEYDNSHEMDIMISELFLEMEDLESEEKLSSEKLLQLAEVYFELGRWNDSKKIYSELLEKDSNKSEIFYGLAMCNFMLLKNEYALTNLVSSFESNPGTENIFLEEFPLLDSTQLYINIFNSIYF